jgi:hypothetical protein
MLETQIKQIATVLPRQSNGDPSQSPIQESMKSIFTVFKGKPQNLLSDLWEELVREMP